MQYKLVESSSPLGLDDAKRELEEKIRNSIADGWRPVGGVSLAATPEHQDSRSRWRSYVIYLAQAMTKE